ncbi:MAG: tRNA (adenosine(37)-N6)-threonylcarbamoyltransferase complex dimerization subunit type 1 TsaB [Leadbetterella sp.]|nr:tRNA (adenosine(37)-N6)-threonylcarbamoyltransferase complex dimerization subunit type 1 TsaB [Leadbetterella sp.]
MILALDASTTGCSVALFKEGEVVFTMASRIDRSSAENLTLMMEQTLRFGGAAFGDLKAVAVAKGPGSYTGLRIAVSTAKGLAFGLGIPLISFGTLPAMCYRQDFTEGIDLLCPMIDARRMEVFCGFYDAREKTEKVPVEAVLVGPDSFAEILEHHRVLFFGEGSAKCREVLTHPNACFAPSVQVPAAEFACKIVSEKWGRREFEDLVTFEPFYLKEYMFKSK